jgi:hypothetical protein
MESMFEDAQYFNQPVGNWNVSNVSFMRDTFYHANRFNQRLSNWNISKVTDVRIFF